MIQRMLRCLNQHFYLKRNSRLLPSLLLVLVTWILYFSRQHGLKPGPSRLSATDNLLRQWHMRDSSHERLPFFNKDKWRDYPPEELIPWRERLYTIGGSRHGDDGKGVLLQDEAKREAANRLRSKHQLNVVVSDMLPLNRTLPEVRHPSCLRKRYPSSLPSLSVIIVFHDEASSTILRTAVSAIDRSSKDILKEIIFVDDASSNEDLRGDSFASQARSLGVGVKVLRLPQRRGLIAARLLGAEESRGSVLFFMDAHMELSLGWSEPLLAEILTDRTKVVAPVIDDIDDEDFSYKRVYDDQMRGGFNWKLHHVWIEPLEVDHRLKNVDPFPTPTIIGGVFAIDREYFFESGAFDPGMKIWGGENIEISLRIWRCGGSLLIVPCSRVGHVYRRKSPHSVPGGFLGQLEIEGVNIGRCARVWFDEYYDFYSYMNPKNVELGDLSSRLKLKQGCHDMDWYLSTVYPDSPLPIKCKYIGQIRTAATKECLDGIGSNGKEVGVRLCHGLGSYQTFMLKDSGQIQCDVYCLSTSSSSGEVVKKPCSTNDAEQRWSYSPQGQIIHSNSGLCLAFTSAKEETHNNPKSVLNYLAELTKESFMASIIPGPTLGPCDQSLSSQQWTMNEPVRWNK